MKEGGAANDILLSLEPVAVVGEGVLQLVDEHVVAKCSLMSGWSV